MNKKIFRGDSFTKKVDDSDHVYYNLVLNNPNNVLNKSIPAQFNETRSTSILENPSDYTLSVIRFSLSKVEIPIFHMNIFPKYSITPKLGWRSTSVYILNQGTLFNGNTYVSIIDNNIGNQPDISPTSWRFVPPSASDWNSNANYAINAGATYNGIVYVSLVNGNIGNIPISSPSQWGVSQLPPVLDNISYNLSQYAVSMFYEPSGAQQTEYIIYEPISDTTVVLPPNDWSIIDISNSRYYSVYIFSQFIQMINSALKSCYNHMPSNSPPKVAKAPAPYLLLDPNTLIVSLVAHKTFDTNFVQTDTIKISFNTTLMTFFNDALQYDFFAASPLGDPLDYALVVNCRGDNVKTLLYPDINYPTWQNTLNYLVGHGTFFNGVNYVAIANSFGMAPDISPAFWSVQTQTPIPVSWQMNPPTPYVIGQIVQYNGSYYINKTGLNSIPTTFMDWDIYTGFDMIVMSGDYSNLYNWSDVQSILFVSELIPVVNEFIPAGVLNPNSTIGGTSTSNPTLQIITDFVPDIQTGTDINSNIVFFNQGEYRLSDLVSDTPLRSIKIKLYYTDRNNQLFPIFIKPYGIVSCKILFRKKNIKGNLTY